MIHEYQISFIIPVYKVEKYLERCVNSLLAQNLHQVEIVLVDDGSPDRCPAICDHYREQYGNVRVIHKANGGLSSAIRAGTQASQGKYIAYVDSDDWVELNLIEEIWRVLTEHNNVDLIVYGFNRVINEQKKNEHIHYLLDEGYYEGRECDSIKATYMRPGGIGQTRWNKIYKRALAMKTLDYYDERVAIGEDIIFTAPAVDLMQSVYVIKQPLVNYFINDQAMTQNFSSKYFDDFSMLYLALFKYFGEADILFYINYINMRTLVNAVNPLSLSGKLQFLKMVFHNCEVQDRLARVNITLLDRQNRLFLSLMRKSRIRLMLAAAWIRKYMR
jgi:glycosyltransferase involved in cell wall biosynthesis